MTTTRDLWNAVDTITKPTRRKVTRDTTTSEPAAELLHNLAHNPTRTVCHIGEYRRAMAQIGGQALGWATVPALWDQAVAAVHGQGDSDGGGSVPKRERSVADLALMETLHDVRALLLAELKERQLAARSTVPGMMRQVASNVAVDDDPETLEWWTWRVEHWARSILTHLNAAEDGPRPFRLRDSPCPECGVRQVRVKEAGEWRLVPPLRIDFRDGHVRAATCTKCRHAWFRGDDMEALATKLGRSALAEHADTAQLLA